MAMVLEKKGGRRKKKKKKERTTGQRMKMDMILLPWM
jgi:hypothetical protein